MDVIGLAADTTKQLKAMRDKHELPFSLLSDPHLISRSVFDLPTSTAGAYISTMALHPSLRHLPKRAFLQPAMFVYEGGVQRYAWRQTEKVRNLLGARSRPTPQQIADITSETLETSAAQS